MSNSNVKITTLEIPQHFVHSHVNLHNQTRSPTGSMATSVVVSSTGQPVFKPHFHLAMFVVESELPGNRCGCKCWQVGTNL